MVQLQPNGSVMLSGDATSVRTVRAWRWMRWVNISLVVVILAACSSTQGQATSQVERQVEQMRVSGVEFVNLRASPIRGKQGERIAENYEFDIPSINIKDDAAGTIRIFKDADFAESQKRMYAFLGAPGPTTKLDYVTIEGTRALILNHQLPREMAQRYIDAFVKTAPAPST